MHQPIHLAGMGEGKKGRVGTIAFPGSGALLALLFRFLAGGPFRLDVGDMHHFNAPVGRHAGGIACFHAQTVGGAYLYAAVAHHTLQAVDTPGLLVLDHAYGS